MHARPWQVSAYLMCSASHKLISSITTSFYCIVLLTALFISSCYWQPLPIDSPLSTPWSANITTFSDAMNAFMPGYEFDYRPNDDDNSSTKKPTVLKLMDRCWCDFSSGSFFEPFNVSAWEIASVKRFKKELLLGKERAAEKERAKLYEAELERDTTGFAAPTPAPSPRHITAMSGKEKRDTFDTLRSVFWRAPSSAGSSLKPPSSVPAETHLADERRPVTPWEFDLEPYGFDLVLDFRWTRPSS